MRRALPLILLVGLAACSSGDDMSTPTSTAGDTTTPTTEPVDFVPLPCSDVPDPARYVEGQIPLLVPPCTVPDELVVHTIREGTGEPAEVGDTLVVDYAGMIIGGEVVFDTSYIRDIPFDFPLGRGGVIDGWDQGLIGAQAGSLLRLDIPTALAYGDTPPGDQIQPGDALSFNIEVRAVVPAVTAEDAPLDLDITPSIGATGLTITDLTVGDGRAAEAGDTAIVQMLLVRGDNEVVLFNTWERSEPLQIILSEGQSLPGIIEGLEGATVGTRRVLAMPPDLAFGPAGEPSLGLPAATDLIVIVDVVGVY